MNQAPVGAPQNSSSKLVWVVALVIVVAAAALVFLFLARRNVQAPVTQMPPAPKLKVDKKDLAANQVPDKFPQELLALEQSAKLTQNYNASAADGRFQATRAYETTKSLADAIKVYRDFFTKNGWAIQDSLDQDKLKVIIAIKDNNQVLVVADENATTKVHTVVVTATLARPAGTGQ